MCVSAFRNWGFLPQKNIGRSTLGKLSQVTDSPRFFLHWLLMYFCIEKRLLPSQDKLQARPPQSTYIQRIPLCMSPRLPTPLSSASVPLPPEPGGGAHSPAGEGLGESQFRRLQKKLSTLHTLWRPPPTKGKAKAISEWSSTCKEPRRGQLPAWGRSPWEASPDRQDGGAPAYPVAGTRSR